MNPQPKGESQHSTLVELYYNENTGLQSANKLYEKAKVIDKNITHKMVEEFLRSQETAQITKEVHRNKDYYTISSPAVKNNYQIDLMYLPNPRQNKNYKYLLTWTNLIKVMNKIVFYVITHQV